MQFATTYRNETIGTHDSYNAAAAHIADAVSEARPGTPEADDSNYSIVNAEDAAEDEERCDSCGRPVCPMCGACEACGPTCDCDEAPWREATEDEDLVTIETMPDHLRSSHRAARNWGTYPHNGAERSEVTREEAEEIIAADEDGYDHIVE